MNENDGLPDEEELRARQAKRPDPPWPQGDQGEQEGQKKSVKIHVPDRSLDETADSKHEKAARWARRKGPHRRRQS